MNNKEVFSYNLNFYMKEKQKSRREVAEAIDVSYFTFTDWVKGKTYPRMDKVEKLANYFGVKISDLIEVKGIEEKPEETATLHAKILTDLELIETIEEYYLLSVENQKMVRELIRNLQKQEP
jgi:transcriptional regulator with XRE-family HTH domain